MKEMTKKAILILWAMPILLMLGCLEYSSPASRAREAREEKTKTEQGETEKFEKLNRRNEKSKKFKARDITKDDGTVLEGPEIEIGKDSAFFDESDDEDKENPYEHCEPIDREKKSITCKTILDKEEIDLTFALEDQDLDNEVFDDKKNCWLIENEFNSDYWYLNCFVINEKRKTKRVEKKMEKTVDEYSIAEKKLRKEISEEEKKNRIKKVDGFIIDNSNSAWKCEIDTNLVSADYKKIELQEQKKEDGTSLYSEDEINSEVSNYKTMLNTTPINITCRKEVEIEGNPKKYKVYREDDTFIINDVNECKKKGQNYIYKVSKKSFFCGEEVKITPNMKNTNFCKISDIKKFIVTEEEIKESSLNETLEEGNYRKDETIKIRNDQQDEYYKKVFKQLNCGYVEGNIVYINERTDDGSALHMQFLKSRKEPELIDLQDEFAKGEFGEYTADNLWNMDNDLGTNWRAITDSNGDGKADEVTKTTALDNLLYIKKLGFYNLNEKTEIALKNLRNLTDLTIIFGTIKSIQIHSSIKGSIRIEQLNKVEKLALDFIQAKNITLAGLPKLKNLYVGTYPCIDINKKRIGDRRYEFSNIGELWASPTCLLQRPRIEPRDRELQESFSFRNLYTIDPHEEGGRFTATDLELYQPCSILNFLDHTRKEEKNIITLSKLRKGSPYDYTTCNSL